MSGSLADGDKGVDSQLHSREELVVDVEAIIDKVVGSAVECGHSLPEQRCVCGGDIEKSPRACLIVENLVARLHNDAKRGRSTTPEGPEEVGVVFLVGSYQLSIGGDNLELQSGIGEETLLVSQRTVASTLDKTSGNTDSLDQS